jgi:glycosyltransferase involved in cell wall biosynthesis
MVKIVQIVCVYPPYKGGIGNAAFEFQKQFSDMGIDSVVFTPKYNNKVSEADDHVIRLIPVFKMGNAAFTPQLFFLLSKYDVIILHYPFFGAQELVALFKIFFKKNKLIIHFHMDVVRIHPIGKILSLPSQFLKKKLFLLADKITCASLDYVNNSSICNIYRDFPDKFLEINFGVDTSIFFINPNIQLNDTVSESAPKVILFVGGLDKPHYFKGLDVLFEAAAKLSKEINFRINVIGTGELKDEYMIKAGQLGLASQVSFIGNLTREELSGYYRKSYLFVLPSTTREEAFGLVLLEAMACGVPVIASNLPGVRKVFIENEQGFLVCPNDSEDLKIKLEKLLLNPDLRNKMSAKAINLVKDKYSWHLVGEKLNNLISEIIK